MTMLHESILYIIVVLALLLLTVTVTLLSMVLITLYVWSLLKITGWFYRMLQWFFPSRSQRAADEAAAAMDATISATYITHAVDENNDATSTMEDLYPLQEKQEAFFASKCHGKIEKLIVPKIFAADSLKKCLLANRTTLKFLTLCFEYSPFSEARTPSATRSAIAHAVGAIESLEHVGLFESSVVNRCHAIPVLAQLIDHPNLRSLIYAAKWDADAEENSRAICDILASSTPLQELTIRSKRSFAIPFENVMKTLNHHRTLRVLNIDSRVLFDEETVHVANMLRNNSVLENLSLSCHSMIGVATIMDSLTTRNSALKGLFVTAKALWSTHSPARFDAGCRRLATLLPRVKNLKSFQLWDFGSLPDICKSPCMMRGFKQNTSLSYVDIDSCLTYVEPFDSYWYAAPRKNDDNKDDCPANQAIEYYTTCNKYRPQLAKASTTEMVAIFESLLTHHKRSGASVVFETLRSRDDWIGSLKL